ncbi:hypothetical protein [Jannaschia sp. CCS1]|nr:hypothetical protein [Jannaschia sp. CCS1]
MLLRPLLIAAFLVAAPVAALAQSAPPCDPSTTTCPGSGGNGGVNVDP